MIVGTLLREAKAFPEMLSVVTDPALEVFQVTTDLTAAGNTRGGCFSPDSRRFIFQRHRTAGGLSGTVEFTCCEIEDGFALRVLTSESDPRAATLSGDGAYLYYLSNEEKGVVLKRVSLDDCRTETLLVLDRPVDGVGRLPKSAISRYGSLRADGKMLCAGLNFITDDGADHFAPIFINLETLAIHGFDWEPYSWRVGGQYFRGSDPAHRGHLMMGRANRSQHWDKDGQYSEQWYGPIKRSSLHVVDEEGRIVGTVPVGGQGEGVDHPYWRGGRYQFVIHSGDFNTAPHWRGAMRMADPIACPEEQMYLGKDIPGARRVELTRKFTRPDVCHMSWDLSGDYAVCDTEGWAGRGTPCLQGPAAFLYLAKVIDDGAEDPYVITKYLLHPRCSWNSAFTENCQELSPDRRYVFFNSDWTCQHGSPQVFCARGFTFPEG